MCPKPNNKVFSDRQEKMVANYLGWKQVTGSGSRPFAPGDLNEYKWLGECKTHNTEQPRIAFQKAHWLKISEESRGKFRYPVLFVDNGTQQAKHTWVMTFMSVLDPDHTHVIEGLKNTAIKGSSLTFDLAETTSLYQRGSVDGEINVFKIFWDRELAVMPLSVFAEFLREYF